MAALVFLITLAVNLIDPIRFIIILLIVLLSKNKWIILIAAVISAVIVETIIIQNLRDVSIYPAVWGQGLLVGFIACLIQAWIVFAVRSWLIRRKKAKNESIRRDEDAREA